MQSVVVIQAILAFLVIVPFAVLAQLSLPENLVEPVPAANRHNPGFEVPISQSTGRFVELSKSQRRAESPMARRSLEPGVTPHPNVADLTEFNPNGTLDEMGALDPPSLTTQPKGASRFLGTSIVFEVGANGSQLSYQWKKDGTDISGATHLTLTITGLSHEDAGTYAVVVSNPAGSVTSTEVFLAIRDLPGDASSLKSGLAVYLQFEGNYDDSSGNNHNASAVGSPEFTTGMVGTGAVRVRNNRSSLSFNFVTLGTNDANPYGESNDFTVAYWMKTERVSGDPSIVANKNWGSGNNVGWTIGTQHDGRLEWNYTRTGADGLSRKDLDALDQGLADSQWHQVVVVWQINGDSVSYVDGAEVPNGRISLAPGTGDIFDPSLALNIGQDGTGAYADGEWDGLIDELAIWDRALTSAEASTLYAFGVFGDSFLSPPVTTGLGAYLKFDGEFSDSSSNVVDITAVGTPTFVPGRIGQGVHLNTDRTNAVFNYVSLGNSDKVHFGETQDFSVAFWVKLNRWSADPAFISNKDWGSGDNTGWVIATDSDGRVQWNYRRDGQDRKDFDSVGGLVSDLGWHHIGVVFEVGAEARTYVDGVEIAMDRRGNPARKDLTPATGTLFDPAWAVNIGQDGTGHYSVSNAFDGVIDDLAIWNRTLSGREIAFIFGQGLKGVALDGTSGPTEVSLGYSVTGTQLSLTWIGDGYTLEENPVPTEAASWTPALGAGANSATVPLNSAMKFYRLKK